MLVIVAQPRPLSLGTRGRARIAARARTAAPRAEGHVLAIVIRLLVLNIGVPAGSETTCCARWSESGSYLAYLVSFATIGAVWFG